MNTVRRIDTFPAGFTCTTGCFWVGTIAGDYLWFPPSDGYWLLRVHRLTGAMTAYNSGFTMGGFTMSSTINFGGAAYDRSTQRVFMVPFRASHLVWVDASPSTTGTMGYCPTWPGGFSGGSMRFVGGFNHQDTERLWMFPYQANMVIRVNPSDCSMIGVNGISVSGGKYHGFGYDGEITAYLPPFQVTSILKLNILSGVFTNVVTSWPTGYGGGSYRFGGAACDGPNMWLAAYYANMIVSVDRATDAMTGYNNWPNGFNPSNLAMKFLSCSFDGMYVWFVGLKDLSLLRMDPSTGVLIAFENCDPC